MFKPSFLAASVAACSSFAFAAETVLPTMVVTASRLPQTQSDVIGDISVVSRQQLDNYRGQSVADVLAGQPGLQMSSNGGAGSTSSIFIRGTNSSHALVLIDGIRHGSATLGTPTLQHIPADQIDHIEILRGPAASLYGSDAIGGVIQIFTRQGNAQTPVSLSVSAGSQNSRQTSLTVYQKTGATEISTTLAHQESDGISALADKTNALIADKDGYLSSSASVNAKHRFDTGHELGASLLLVQGKHQYDSTYATPGYNSHEEVRESAANLWSRNQITDIWTSRVQLGQSMDDGTDFAPVSATDLTDSAHSIFTTKQRQASWINEIALNTLGIMTLGAEGLKQEVSGTTDYAVKERRVNSYLAGYLIQLDAVSMQANLRRDHNSQFGNHKSYNVGVSWSFLPDWQAGASAGTGFKAPTLNDLYWPADPYSYGNPDLKLETSHNQELFVRLTKASVQTALTLYHNRVDDLIVWTPDANYVYSPNNVDKANIKGLTYTLDWQPNALNAGVQFDYLNAVDDSGGANDDKQLIQRAKKTGKVYAGFSQGPVQARVEVMAQGKRFDDAANTDKLAGYSIVNLSASWQLCPELGLGLRINNALDKDYTLSKNYSTYGRNGLLTLTWQPK